jgi:hypothetical protein
MYTAIVELFTRRSKFSSQFLDRELLLLYLFCSTMRRSSLSRTITERKGKEKPSTRQKNPIRTLVVKGVEYWMVTLPKDGGGRHRRYFRTEGEAKTYLQKKRVELLNHGTASLAITDSQRVAMLSTLESVFI